MFWHPSELARAAVAAALIVPSAPVVADVMVVRSVGPSARRYPAGARLAETARVTLQSGDEVTMLDEHGARALRGPGTFDAGAAPRRAATPARAQAQRRAGLAGPARPPSIWHVDFVKSATICIANPAAVTLWRRDSSAGLALTITRLPDGATRNVAFPVGATTAVWPADLRISDGAHYRVSWPGAAQPSAITFRTPERPFGLQNIASTLIRNGCSDQLDNMIETVRLPGEVPKS